MIVNRPKTTTSRSHKDNKNAVGSGHDPPAVSGHMEDPETCLSILVHPSVSLCRCFAAFSGTFDRPTPQLDQKIIQM